MAGGGAGPSFGMLARIRSAAVLGIDAYLVDVETDIAPGRPRQRFFPRPPSPPILSG